jgi:hypothetical protein
MVFSLEHDIKVTKNHQNLLPTQSVLVAHTVVVYLTSSCVNWGFLARVAHFKTRVKRAF